MVICQNCDEKFCLIIIKKLNFLQQTTTEAINTNFALVYFDNPQVGSALEISFISRELETSFIALTISPEKALE